MTASTTQNGSFDSSFCSVSQTIPLNITGHLLCTYMNVQLNIHVCAIEYT